MSSDNELYILGQISLTLLEDIIYHKITSKISYILELSNLDQVISI